MKRLIQLLQVIPEFTVTDINKLAIQKDNVDIVSGAEIYALMEQYLLRYCLLDGDTPAQLVIDYIYSKWKGYVLYRGADIIRTIEALYADYDPLSDYAMHEEELKRHNDGEDTTTVSNKYDYTVTDSADSLNQPTYSNYVTTYNDTSPRLESQRIDSGGRTTHTLAADETKNVKTTEYTHTEAEMTVGDSTVSADKIDHTVRDKSGHVHKSAQQLSQETIDLYKHSAIESFVNEFMQRYTFYVGGGISDCKPI